LNWSSYVNESLYFAQLQLTLRQNSQAIPKKLSAEYAAVFFLHRAYTGFLNELAHKRRVKEQVKDLTELEQRLEVESAEIRQLKRAREENGWLAQLDSLVGTHSRPRIAASDKADNIIATSTESLKNTDIEQVLVAMKRCFNELREVSTEY